MPSVERSRRPDVLRVRLGTTEVGTITQLGGHDRNLFVFDQDYLDDAQRPTLSLSFLDVDFDIAPKKTEELTRSKVPPFFSNLLPEGALRDYVAKAAGVNPEHEFMLLWTLGADLPGNVTVEDVEGRRIASTERSAHGKTEKEPAATTTLRFSLAGVQLKFSPTGSPKTRFTIPVEGVGGRWIVKLQSSAHASLPENEFSMMDFAKNVGIHTPEFGLIPGSKIGGLPAGLKADEQTYYIKRFDRRADGGRIHIEDFNQIYGQFPDDKYDNWSYNNIARDIDRVMGEEELREYIRRLVFNILIGNMDMHLKNWSVMYEDERRPRLSPGYDFVSTVVYPGVDRGLALSIGGTKIAQEVDLARMARFADKAQISGAMVKQETSAIVEKMQALWPEQKKRSPLSKKTLKAIEDHLESVPLYGLQKRARRRY